MISYAHILPLVVCFFILTFLRRFWICISRFGAMKEVSRCAPELIQNDLLSASVAITPFVLALADWLQIVPPRASGPISSPLAVLISFACALGSLLLISRSEYRIAGSWAGTRESALRTLAALQIINATEMVYSLKFAEKFRSEGEYVLPSEVTGTDKNRKGRK
ncbi:hypothetical protein [uncultured Pseudomonas sp.]|uniref:hypothetical protein n=1 Tax=uncultured Pseudomonas sp. TaxID=114707 RepID=UPI00258D4E38|nr:hypothetical protein [uncultured Pseudomonas sp.]